ncbi:MAG: hypothetical protein AB8H80_14915 [Planctomycetota bacterium]
MKILSAIAAGALAIAAGAQSNTINVAPTGTGLTWNGASGANNYVDLDVTDPVGVTIQALGVAVQNAAGTEGNIEVWLTPTTHVGNELNQALWTQIGTGSFVSGGFGANNTICVNPTAVGSTFVPTGQWGLAIVYVDVRAQFTGVTTYPTGPYSGPGLDVDNGAAQAAGWTGATLVNFTFNGILHVGCVPQFDLIYASGNVAHACSTVASIGEGSNRLSASAFDLFDEPAASPDASGALQGNSLLFIPNGTFDGYTITAGGGAFIPPSGNETSLTLMNDEEFQTTLTLPVLLVSDVGVELGLDLIINSNGYVSFVQTPGGLGVSPLDPQGAMQADSLTYFGGYHNFNPAEAGSGVVSFEEDTVNNRLIVTWQDVESDPDLTPNPSTIQYQFDYATGIVEVIYELIDPVGGSTIIGGDNWLIGWSPAGPSPRVEEFDYTTIAATPLNVQLPEVLPLTLTADGLPLIGQSFDLITSNDPTPSFGVNLLNTATLPAPLDLGALGAPAGTLTYLDPSSSILNTIGNLPGAQLTLTLPVANVPALAGLEINSQSFWLDFTGAGFPFTNLVASNLVTAIVGNF